MNNTQTDTGKVIVRYPPSPTGNLHIGNIRTLLFNYLFAKHHESTGGSSEIFMRFEDTDKERSKREYEDVAIETLSELGLTFDHGPFRQSERLELYKSAINQLIKSGNAYEAEQNQAGTGNVIRFKNPNTTITFKDTIRGEISIDTTDFGDFVIARSLENPLYHLTVVVDDIDMGITHVIRGEDHITSTPRQILLINALGGQIPQYAHLPLIIGADKKKLGKRHGATTYQEFKQLGYLPEAIINYLALLGWSEGNDREFYTIEELIKVFRLSDVNNSPAMFSYEKLDSINRHYIMQMTKKEVEEKIYTYLTQSIKEYIQKHSDDIAETIIHSIIKERISKWSDIKDVCDNELSWLNTNVETSPEKLIWKKSDKQTTKKHLEHIAELLSSAPTNIWSNRPEDIKELVWDYADINGRGDVLWPMRYALTGKEKSPDPFTVAFILGKEEVLKRLQNSITLLSQ